MDPIQWYPGHMVKAKKLIKEHLKVIDLVIELVDARIPFSSRNPDLKSILENKDSVLVFNKADLADPIMTEAWLKYFQEDGIDGIAIAANQKVGIKKFTKWLKIHLEKIKVRQKAKGRLMYIPKIMVTGIPNVGKSSLINSLGGKASAKTANKPGVTKGQQWIKHSDFYLLDVPGVLWPKFDNQEMGCRLAASGAIGDHVFDFELVANWLIDFLKNNYLKQLTDRYKINSQHNGENISETTNAELLTLIGKKRGLLISGGEVDNLKVAKLVIKEFRDGKIGQISLEKPTGSS